MTHDPATCLACGRAGAGGGELMAEENHRGLAPITECEWCPGPIKVSINWADGHACAMCEACFGTEGIDVLDMPADIRCVECMG